MAHDRVIEELRELHDCILAAARSYVAGDAAAAVEQLSDTRIALTDVIADLRRAERPT